MKLLLLLAFFAFTVAGCSKKEDTVTPNAVSLVSGTYAMTYYRRDSAGVKFEINLPYMSQGKTLVSGTMTLTKGVAANSVNLNYQLKSDGSDPENYYFGSFTLQQAGSGYDLYDGTTKYGSADGTSLSYDETFTGSDKAVYHLIVTAKK